MSDNDFNTICYFEIGSTNLEESKAFYTKCFEWQFNDQGPEYSMFGAGELGGGISTQIKPTSDGTKLVIKVNDITKKTEEIIDAGGESVGEIIDIGNEMGFYQYFKDNCGNQLALWSQTN
ncbi:MAG: hypothetical protein COA79_04665 [Planctomycetota bacterium]|nr:MAG: hypothetical protein COA79_04665 [Planctomycetota bacterium]